jgi:hypothetical protein
MSDWDDAAAAMDAEVDARLGDTISYALDGVNFVDMPGFVLPAVEGIGLNELDPALGHRWRVKISKALVAEPLRTHRLSHPKLGVDTYRPAGDDPDDQGRYWIFDIQKVDD